MSEVDVQRKLLPKSACRGKEKGTGQISGSSRCRDAHSNLVFFTFPSYLTCPSFVSLVIPNSAISTPSFHSIHFMLFKFAQ